MRSTKLPWFVLAGITAVFIGGLIATADSLPEHVATHFDISGHADGWMPRRTHITLISAVGLGESVFVALLAYCTRFLPSSVLRGSAKREEQQLSPSQRAATHSLVAEFGAWLACVGCLFALGLHLVVLAANRVNPPVLPAREFLLFLGAFVALLGVWVGALIRRVKRGAR